MDISYISALSALAGSVIGGLTSGIAAWFSQRAQVKASQLAHDRAQREELYKDFIVAVSEAHGDAIVSDQPKIQELIAIYAMISRMRVLSPPRTVTCAEKTIRAAIDAYFAPNKTISELHEMMKSATKIDPLKEFSEAARGELRVLG
jgi:hypothetical protein